MPSCSFITEGTCSDNRIDNLELWSNGHPYGQRVTNLINFAKLILTTYAIDGGKS
jgi:hypothetical protein